MHQSRRKRKVLKKRAKKRNQLRNHQRGITALQKLLKHSKHGDKNQYLQKEILPMKISRRITIKIYVKLEK